MYDIYDSNTYNNELHFNETVFIFFWLWWCLSVVPILPLKQIAEIWELINVYH